MHGRKFLPNLHGVGEGIDNTKKVALDENIGISLTPKVVLVPY